MSFFVHFFISNVFIVLLLGFLLFIRRIFQTQLTIPARYHLWYPFILALFVPFCPFPNNWLKSIPVIFTDNQRIFISDSTSNMVPDHSSISSNLYDYAVAFEQSPLFNISRLLQIIWIAGMVLMFFFLCYNIGRIYHIEKNAYRITNETEPELYEDYYNCLKKLHIQKSIPLYASCQISTPISYGILRPRIVIPQDMDILLEKNELKFILLHELQHYKHKDAIFNTCICILQILYWFHPFLWYAFKQFQKDREITCDYYVMQAVGRKSRVAYAYTLIHYMEKRPGKSFFSPLSTFGGEKKLIFLRIEHILNYEKHSYKKQIKSILILILTMLIITCISPFFAAYAFQPSLYSLGKREFQEIDLKSYFPDSNGTFVLYDINQDYYQIYNKEGCLRRVSPDSTYKIYSGLFALEEGLITPNHSFRSWDRTSYSFNTWNQDQTLTTALQNSVNWYFQNLDKAMGYSKLSSYYKKISYGNCDISGGINRYWCESSLKISPLEQVDQLSAFLENQWNFQDKNILAVKHALFLEETDIGKLYGKTGTGMQNGKYINGWFVGFLETDKTTFCFAVNLHDTDDANGKHAAGIALDILNDLL